MIVNDDSSIVSWLSFKLIDDPRVVIYDCHRFIILALGAKMHFCRKNWNLTKSTLWLSDKKSIFHLTNLSWTFSCGLYYKHLMIVNDDSSIISWWSFKLIDDPRVVIYDRHRFIILALGAKMHFCRKNWNLTKKYSLAFRQEINIPPKQFVMNFFCSTGSKERGPNVIKLFLFVIYGFS